MKKQALETAIFTKKDSQKLSLFFLLILTSVGINYLLPATFSSLFFLGCLVIYFFSRNEPFWLVFFLVLGDGFFGFFGPGKVLQSVIPGLPAVEVIQLYILLTIVKTVKVKETNKPFYNNFLVVLLVYLFFLVLQGYVVGISLDLNIQFRLVKYLLPLFLLYSIPKLLKKEGDFQDCLTYIFPITFFALGAQLISVITGLPPEFLLSLSSAPAEAFELTDEQVYRGFFNVGIVLLSTLGALVCLTQTENRFRSGYLYAVLLANGINIFLSATRGWIIGYTFIILSFILFISGVKTQGLVKIIFTTALAIVIIASVPELKLQINNAYERIRTLEAIAEGDLTAQGTLIRLERRVPRVMKKWRESPLTGWGFSKEYFDYADGHVGNHNLLMHSGLIGTTLLMTFFIYFNAKIILKSRESAAQNPFKKGLLVFSVFFLGWFIIHSTSWQYFSFYQDPSIGVVQAVFFSWAAAMYRETGKSPKAHLINTYRTIGSEAYAETHT